MSYFLVEELEVCRALVLDVFGIVSLVVPITLTLPLFVLLFILEFLAETEVLFPLGFLAILQKVSRA